MPDPGSGSLLPRFYNTVKLSPVTAQFLEEMCAATLKEHQHGKSRVRLGRTWREGDVHHFVEWTVNTMLESDMAHAFQDGSNTDMTATDTQKNTVGSCHVLYQP